MRILIHGINFSPELIGIGKYSGEMAKWLAAQGHEVRVVTAPPYYPQWRVADGYTNRWRREVLQQSLPLHLGPLPEGEGMNSKGSVVVYRCPLWVPAKPSGLKRLLHLASFALSSFPIMLRQIFWRPDVVWVVEPALMCAPGALVTARLSGGMAWLHVQDYEVDAAFDLGLLKGALARRLVTGLERWLMRRFDRVSTISERMLARASAKGVAEDQLVDFPNWIDLDAIQPLSAPSCYRAELGIAADAVVALYSGNMGGKQGLEIMAEAARLCAGNSLSPSGDTSLVTLTPQEGEGSGVVFVFCGNGAGRADLVALCDGLPNVHFLDLQPMDRLNDLLGLADIHLLPQKADAADLVMPSKLTGMLASGRAVVATAHADTGLGRVLLGCGLLAAPGQPQAFADAINTLVQDAALRTRLGSAGRAYAEAHLDRDSVLARFEAEMRTAGKWTEAYV